MRFTAYNLAQTMRHILTVEQILCFSKLKMDISEFEKKLEDKEFRYGLAKKYASSRKLHNGATLEFPADGYRNHNLLFWDALNKEIVAPFYHIDDYGSVPPRFVVGDGYFEPYDWLDEVDHNSVVFPARPLIDEMKAFAAEHPDQKKMIVTINGLDYTVRYSPEEMRDNWESCVIQVDKSKVGYVLNVYPGELSWRETIVD